jgi:hypothetical protein
MKKITFPSYSPIDYSTFYLPKNEVKKEYKKQQTEYEEVYQSPRKTVSK